MPDNDLVESFALKVDALRKLAEEIYSGSEDFPAVNRNVKRILASIEMLKINLETGSR